eukprot:scaffold228144_cov15-Tisochrysis_lutea.AAC.1
MEMHPSFPITSTLHTRQALFKCLSCREPFSEARIQKPVPGASTTAKSQELGASASAKSRELGASARSQVQTPNHLPHSTRSGPDQITQVQSASASLWFFLCKLCTPSMVTPGHATLIGHPSSTV